MMYVIGFGFRSVYQRLDAYSYHKTGYPDGVKNIEDASKLSQDEIPLIAKTYLDAGLDAVVYEVVPDIDGKPMYSPRGPLMPMS